MMSTEGDRRTQEASRIPFEALVEVGGALGPSFEAQAVNISEDGMQMRTAYLPEKGQPLTCRFDAGPGQSVLASGEVIWTEQAGKGGEFGIRFTDMDPESVDVLRRMCGVADAPDPVQPQAAPGAKVRLHIDGLASPMRARVKGAHHAEVTVGSDLGFLQVGKDLDLEDAESGTRRAAKIDRVDVAVDPNSHVPQLVVTLRYADADDAAEAKASDDAPRPVAIPVEEEAPAATNAREDDAMDKASRDMKGAFARGVSQIGPAFAKIATRAKTTVALLAAKRAAAGDDKDAPRRTTAPAPGGGLHTAGRKVVRGDSMSDAHEEGAMDPKFKITKRKVAIAGAVVVAVTLGAIAMRKPQAQTVAAADVAAAASTSTAATPLLTATHLPPLPKPPEAIAATTAGPLATAPLAPPPSAPMAMGSMPETDPATDGANPTAHDKHKKNAKVAPFGNGPVSHGNILHLKMDGAIEQIQGASQPTGFTVKIPGRKSLEAAGPLAARDGRIAAVKVTNDGAGAELTFTFKDGVPNYQVRAKGETLEIALAPVGKAHDKAIAKKGGDKKHGATAKKHDKSPDKH